MSSKDSAHDESDREASKYFTPAFMVQLYLGILLLVVIMFQTGSVIFEKRQRRYQILKDIDDRRERLKKEMKGGAQP